jgi:hypothetical protein
LLPAPNFFKAENALDMVPTLLSENPIDAVGALDAL